jgi:predicted ATPase
MPEPVTVLRTVLVCDLVDSTKLVAGLGDERAAHLFGRHDRLARDLLATWNGQEIDKTDGFLLLFERPADAIRWAMAYHDAMRSLGAELGVPLSSRVGVHMGDVVLRTNPPEDVARGAKPIECEGLAKVAAARISSLAVANQTLASSPVAEVARRALEREPEVRFAAHGAFLFKGLPTATEIVEIGKEGVAPLKAPPSSEKAARVGIANNLPREGASFVGRQAELAAIAEQLGSVRLLTLLGPGGTGKTRLSLRYASGALERYPGGVFFCDLTQARGVDGVCQSVAAALDVPLTIGEPVKQLGDVIAGRGRALVVLDNFEQVVAAAPQTVATWLARAPEVRFLVSSREPLQIAGEQRLPVDPLPVPTAADAAHNDAVALFVDRARAVKPGFALGPDNVADVAGIVRELDGLPLAIELAAARVAMLPPAKLRERLSRRFELLRANRRDLSDRQATLRGAIDWSWNLLQPWEQAALAQASVFAGGFSLEAAERVLDLAAWPDAPWPMDVVQALLEKSLLRSWETAGGEPRYGMLASIREYAADKLGAADAVPGATGPEARRDVRARHAALYAELGTDDQLDRLLGPDGFDVAARLVLELENLVAAAESAAEARDAPTAVAACRAALEVYRQQGPFEQGVRLGQNVREVCDDPLLAAILDTEVARLLRFAGKVGEARARLEAALGPVRAAKEPRREALILHMLALASKEKLPLLEQALALHREHGTRAEAGTVLGNMGYELYRLGRVEEASRAWSEAIAIQREAGNRRSEARLMGSLAVAKGDLGDIPGARSLFESALLILGESSARRSEGVLIGNLAELTAREGRFEEALDLYHQALQIHRQVGNRRFEATVLAGISVAFWERGRLPEAGRAASEALQVARETGDRRAEARARLCIAQTALQAGDLDAAERESAAALDLAPSHLPSHQGVLLGLRGEIRALRGDLHAAIDDVVAGETLVRAQGSRHDLGWLLVRRARVERLAGREIGGTAGEAAAIGREIAVSADSALGAALRSLD